MSTDDKHHHDGAYAALNAGLILALALVFMAVGALCSKGILQLIDALQSMGG